MSSQSSSSSKSSINSTSSPVQGEANMTHEANRSTMTTATMNVMKKSSLKQETGDYNEAKNTMKTMQVPKMGSSFRRNSDTILMNQYLKLPLSSHHASKKVMFNTPLERARTRSNELVEEEDDEEEQQQQRTSGIGGSVSVGVGGGSDHLVRDVSQSSLVFDYSNPKTMSKSSLNAHQSSPPSSSGDLQHHNHYQQQHHAARSPQSTSPLSSPNQSQQSLHLHQKLSALFRFGIGMATSSHSVASTSNATLNDTAGGVSTPKSGSSFGAFNMSPSKSVVQYLNDKFLRKRHSVSILKFNSTSSGSNSNSALTSAAAQSTANFLHVNNNSINNSKLEKSASNHSFLSCTPQIRLHTDTDSSPNDDATLIFSSVSTPSTPTPTASAAAAIVASPTRLKIPFKLKASSSRSTGSFKSFSASKKAKAKTKRSTSAPINQRKILVNSTFYTLLSTNYGDTLLSSDRSAVATTTTPNSGGGLVATNTGNGVRSVSFAATSLSPTSATTRPSMCVFCEQKRHSNNHSSISHHHYRQQQQHSNFFG